MPPSSTCPTCSTWWRHGTKRMSRPTVKNIDLPPRRRIPVWAMLPVVILVIAGGLAAFYLFMPLDAPIPDDLGAQYAGLERGYTEQSFPRLGSASAPVLVEEFSSFACPHCRDFHDTIFPTLLDEIAAGQVQFVFIPVPHIGPGAETAARGAFCAGEQGLFWEMSDVLFDWQKRFVTQTFNERRIRKGARSMPLDAATFNACMSADRPKNVIAQARSEFDQRGLSGTPTLFINGQQVRDYAELNNLGDLAQHIMGGDS